MHPLYLFMALIGIAGSLYGFHERYPQLSP